MNRCSDTEFSAFVGIDWANAKHDICVQAAGSDEREFIVLAHRPESIAQWFARAGHLDHTDARDMAGWDHGGGL